MAGDHAPHAGREHGVDARRRATVVRAGLERDVERPASRALAGLEQRGSFGMRFAVGAVIAASDHLARWRR